MPAVRKTRLTTMDTATPMVEMMVPFSVPGSMPEASRAAAAAMARTGSSDGAPVSGDSLVNRKSISRNRSASALLSGPRGTQIINDDDYGLLKNAADSQRIQTRAGAPTPDDMDELLSKVWKEPSFYLAHPRAIAAFQRQCTRRGVTPVFTSLAGGTFLTWRGIPVVPTDKLLVDGLKNPKSQSGKTNILLVRTGESKRGVIGLFQAGLKNEAARGLSVRFRGIDNKGVASYLLSLYCSAAILADDAIGVLEDVEVGEYYDYD